MHSIKAKRLLRAAEALRAQYPNVAAELETLVHAAITTPRAGKKEKIEGNLKNAADRIFAKLPADSFALAGGFAVLHWVDIRKTYDLDFCILSDTFAKIDQIFPGGSHKPLIYTVEIEGETIDFLQPKNHPWTVEAIQNAASETFLGHSVRILTPAYLILYKFEAGREKDFADIKALLTLPDVKETARDLIGRYMPHEMEDFDQLALESEYGLIE